MKAKLNIHDTHLGKLTTASGVVVDLRNPKPDMINLLDIATGLGNYCRFGGQIKQFYSVAQHSCVVMLLAPPQLAKEALLHDGSEAYLGDVVKPLKMILGSAYDELEFAWTEVINAKYGLNPELLGQVKQYDKQAVELEDDHRKGGKELQQLLQKFYGTPALWQPQVATNAFYSRLTSNFNTK